MSKELNGKIPAVLETKEAVQEAVFSDQARLRYQEAYPQVAREKINEAIDDMVPFVENATVFRFFPALTLNSLEEVRRNQE